LGGDENSLSDMTQFSTGYDSDVDLEISSVSSKRSSSVVNALTPIAAVDA